MGRRQGREAVDPEQPTGWSASDSVVAVRECMERGDYAGAVEVADRAGINADAPETISLMAEAAAGRRDWPRAVRYHAALAAVSPADRGTRLLLARVLLEAGAVAAARDIVDRLLTAQPTSLPLLRLKREIFRTAGDAGGLDAWLTALAKAEGVPETFVGEVVHMYSDADRFDEADAWIERGHAIHGRTPHLVRTAATLAYRAQRWDEADRLWEEAAALDPAMRRPGAFHRARIAVTQGRNEDAEAHYLDALELEADSVEAAQFLVRHLVDADRVEEASGLLERFRAAAVDPMQSIGLETVLATALQRRMQKADARPADIMPPGPAAMHEAGSGTVAPAVSALGAQATVASDNSALWSAAQAAAFRGALQQNGYAEALAIADRVMERDAAAIETIGLAAAAAVERRDWPRAVRYQAAICAVRPADRAARVALARGLLRAGAIAAAQDVVDRLLQVQPVALSVLKLKLEILDQVGDARRLDAWLAGLADTEAATSEGFISEAIQLLAGARRFDEAVAWIDRGMATHGRTAQLVRLAALVAYRARRWEDADSLWAEAASLDPSVERPAAFHRARIALNLDRRADAEAHYLTASRLDPDSSEAAQFLVRRMAGEGRLDEAEEVLARFRAHIGDSPRSVWLEAVLANARRDVAGAIRLLSEGAQRWPDDLSLHLQWADLLADARDWPRMAEVMAAAERLAPASPAVLQALLRLGLARQDPPDQLLSIIDRLLPHRPDDQTLVRQKANQLIRLGDRRAAVDVLLDGARQHPLQPAFWQSAAANLLILNQPEEIEQLVARARRTFSRDTTTDLVSLAEILEAADRPDEALPLAERAKALDPSAASPRAIAARLWEARGLYRKAWPELVALAEIEPLKGRTLSSYARIGGALARIDAGKPSRTRADLFPDALFDRIGRHARPDPRNDQPVILHVTGSLAAGGAERQVAATVSGLARRRDLGLRPVLVGQDLNPLTGRDFFLPIITKAGVDVEVLSDNRMAGRVRNLVAADPRYRDDVALLSALPVDVANVALPLYQLIRERRPRVVHLWQDSTSVAGGVAAMLAGVPRIVIGTRSTRPIERQRARRWLAGGYHALMRYPGVTLLNNSLNGARDYSDWLGIDAERIATVRNGYNFTVMRDREDAVLTEEVRARVNAGPDDVVIGGVMRCSFEKRPELWTRTVIELAGRDPRVRGVLVGEGPMKAELEAMVAAAGLEHRIWIAGRQTPIEPWMKAMDFLFLTSLTEGLPNVLIEAQSLGTPVATMRVGGAPETVLEGETAIVVDEGSIEQIADTVWPLVADAGLRARFAAAGVAFTEETFGVEAMLDRLAELYTAPVPAAGRRKSSGPRRPKP